MCDVLSTSENLITLVIFQQRLKLDTEYVDQVGVHVLKEWPGPDWGPQATPLQGGQTGATRPMQWWRWGRRRGTGYLLLRVAGQPCLFPPLPVRVTHKVMSPVHHLH